MSFPFCESVFGRGCRLTQRRPATSRQTSVGVWGSGRRGRRPQAAAHPIVRLSTIREPPPASQRQQIPFQVSSDRASPERGGDRNAGGGEQAQAVRVGSADRQSARNLVDSKTLAAPIYGGQWSSIEPAAAGGCRLSLFASAMPTLNPWRIPWIRRNQPLQFMAAGFVFYPAVASGTGHCPAAAGGCRLSLPALPTGGRGAGRSGTRRRPR